MEKLIITVPSYISFYMKELSSNTQRLNLHEIKTSL